MTVYIARPRKRCTGPCGEVRPLVAFHRDTNRADGRRSRCEACDNAAQRRYREEHRKQDLERKREYRETHPACYYQELRDQVLGHYGTTCACCGATDDLTIDHVHGGGTEHRIELFGRAGESHGMYVWLVRNDFPEGYQMLCRPCNSSKGSGDMCRLLH